MGVLKIFNLKIIALLLLSSSFHFSFAQKKDFTLVLDAGHGGHDFGAKGSCAYEKEVTLSLVKKVGALIEKNEKDVNVIYTRDTDVFIPLMTRADIANRNQANLFISIHCNSSANRTPYGTETFVLGAHRNKDNFDVAKRENEVIYMEKDYKTRYEGFNPSSPESVIGLTLMQNVYLENSLKLAKYVEDNFIKENRFSRGVKQAGFLVLVQTAMPSILIETGFISNNQECQYLASEAGQNAIAKNVYDAFLNYKKEFYKKSGKIQTKDKEVEKVAEIPLDNTSVKVQFLASFNRYAESAPQMKGVKDIEIIKSTGKYVYYSGDTKLRSEAERNLQIIKQAGFPDASIVEIKNNEPLKSGYYTIEVLLSYKKYKDKDAIFNGLAVNRDKLNNIFVYTSGKVTTYDAAKNLLESIKKLGFPNAVITQVSQ